MPITTVYDMKGHDRRCSRIVVCASVAVCMLMYNMSWKTGFDQAFTGGLSSLIYDSASPQEATIYTFYNYCTDKWFLISLHDISVPQHDL